MNLDEQVIVKETINSECSHVRKEIRHSVRTNTPISWRLLTKLLTHRVEGFAENGKCFKGIVFGLEARCGS